MLPPKIGDGVFGSSSGGVNPTGASSFAGGGCVLASSAATRNVLEVVSLWGLGVKDKVVDCFHGTVMRSVGFEAEMGGVKREAWVAMAMEILFFLFLEDLRKKK